jgi:hypothetical protein
MDELANQLRQQGVQTEVYQETQWTVLATTIGQHYRGVLTREPLVLIGFSYGADDVLRVSEKLKQQGVSPDLVITIDPVTPPPVPANVQVCYNFFQTNGIWDVLPWLRGIPLKSAGPARLVNMNLRRDHPELLEPNTGHSNIAANRKIHAAVIEQVLNVCPPRDSRK